MIYTEADIHRFWSKVTKAGVEECWIWNGTYSGTGYGAFKKDRKQLIASRVAWTLINGPIPDGGYVCHECDNRNCVNPNHLFISTAKGNAQDMTAKGRHRNQKKTHCGHCGHPFTPENTLPNGEHGRRCRNCHNLRGRTYYETHKADILRRRRVARLTNQRRAK